MRILYVHERFGALGGAEANAVITARELKAKGHSVGLLHGPPTGKGEAAWRDVFDSPYALSPGRNATDATNASRDQDVVRCSALLLRAQYVVPIFARDVTWLRIVRHSRNTFADRSSFTRIAHRRQ